MKKIVILTTLVIFLVFPAVSREPDQAHMIFEAGKARYEAKKYGDAVPAFEYVVNNGTTFSEADYYEAFQKLMVSYNQSGMFSKTIELYENFEKITDRILNPEVYEKIRQRTADACIGLGMYERAASFFQDDEKMLSDLYVRLGIQAYNSRDNNKAEEYFSVVYADSENDQSELTDNIILVCLYRAKIILDGINDNLSDVKPENIQHVKKAESLLKKIEKKVPLIGNSSGVQDFSDSYYSAYLKTEIILRNYKKAREIFRKIKVPQADDGNLYYLAYLEYRENNYAVAEKLYEELISRSYVKSCEIFPYAVCLYKSGKNEAAYKAAKVFNGYEADLICGDSLFNMENWIESCTYYRRVLESDRITETVKDNVLYSLGFASFRAGDFKAAVKYFEDYQSEYPDGSRNVMACRYTLQAYVILGNYEKALLYGEKNLRNAKTAKEKEDAVLALAGIYIDTKKYRECETLLENNKNTTTEFGIKCQDMLASIYYSERKYEQAGKAYSTLMQGIKNNAKKMAEAEYYVFDCDVKLGRKQQIISKGENYCKKYPSSPYCVSVLKEIFQVHYDNKKYNEAFIVSQKLEKEYNTSPGSAGIESQVIFVRRIIDGNRMLEDAQSLYDAGKMIAAGEKYLQAAEILRFTDNGEKAALCLYTATECFASEGQTGDARASSDLLKKLYPGSKYAEAVDRLNY